MIWCGVLMAAAQTPSPPAPPVPPPEYVAAWSESFDAAYPLRMWTGASMIVTGGPTSALEARRQDTGALAWRAAHELPGPLVARDGLVVFAEADRAIALDESDGSTRWTIALPGPVVGLGAFPGGLLVTTAHALAAHRLADGGAVWSAPLAAPPASSPVADDSRVFVALERGALHAFQRNSGEALWHVQLSEAPAALLPMTDRLLFASPSGTTCSIVSRDGRADWCYPFRAEPVGPPVADATRVFVLLKDHAVRALDRRGGNLRWRGQVPFRPKSTLLLRGDAVIAGGPDGDLATFRLDTGRRTMALAAAPQTTRAAGGAVPSLDGLAVAPGGRRVFRLMSTTEGRYTLASFDAAGNSAGPSSPRD